MGLFSYFKNLYISTKNNIQANSLDSLFWLVDILPSKTGFSIQSDEVQVPFWILHSCLLLYVYVVGVFVYQQKYAEGVDDFIKSYVNISLIILVSNNTWWWYKKRPLLRATLKLIRNSDRKSRRSPIVVAKHEKLMKIIKTIVIIFYAFNLINAFFVYWPKRIDVMYNFYMTKCVGLEPLTASPNREICMTLLAATEVTFTNVCLNFQALVVLLIAHTSAMYRLLSYEMIWLSENEHELDIKILAKEFLPSIVDRHALTLDVVENLKSLYSIPIGINFGSNAVCMILFFYLTLQEMLAFTPIMGYCFLVFFLYCFLCQRLVNASEEFERSVYCCGWENFGLKEKKLVYVMLLQAQKPVQILAADIVPVNISTFASTLQAMYRFITVMKF